jgi:hypothetical protein
VQVALDRPASDGIALIAQPSLQRGRVDLPGGPWQHPEHGEEAQDGVIHAAMMIPSAERFG